MNTHTKKWDTLTKWAMATFVLGMIGGIAVLVLTDTNWPLVSLFVFISFAGLVTSFIGAVKAFGGLKTGGASIGYVKLLQQDFPLVLGLLGPDRTCRRAASHTGCRGVGVLTR